MNTNYSGKQIQSMAKIQAKEKCQKYRTQKLSFLNQKILRNIWHTHNGSLIDFLDNVSIPNSNLPGLHGFHDYSVCTEHTRHTQHMPNYVAYKPEAKHKSSGMCQRV